MKIVELIGRRPLVSVELWPPRSPAAEERLERSFTRLRAIRPDFASITYGAAGSTRERTHELVVRLQQEHAIVAMAHLTCAAHRRDELVEILERYRTAGIDNVLALRGDPPIGSDGPLPTGELDRAIDLIELIRSVGDFGIAVAAHPAGHPGADDLVKDRRYLAAKLELADFAITQFFYAPDEYLRLVDDLAALGVDKPVIPGIMPITSVRTLERMAELSGAPVPDGLARRIASTDAADVEKVGLEIATELGAALIAAGAPGLHFFTMNQFDATSAICESLDITRPDEERPREG